MNWLKQLCGWEKTDSGSRKHEEVERAATILFVHGLSGSAKGTWSRMRTVCEGDPDLTPFSLKYYSYNSSFLRLPFQSKMPKIQQLSDGLATEIETLHRHSEKIFLVGHSLGGVVVRQYLVSQLKKQVPIKINGALFTRHQIKDRSRQVGGVKSLGITAI